MPAPRYPFLPQPVAVTAAECFCTISPATLIAVLSDDNVSMLAARHLADFIGAPQPRRISGADCMAGGILLTTHGAHAELGAEGYELTVTADGVWLVAAQPAGLFRGVQTFEQLFAKDLWSGVHRASAVPCVRVKDKPRFAWRGLMLDSGRHFLPVAFIRKAIDLVAMHRMNVLHWHLTDDQGWRLAIRQYPRLTEVGSVRAQSPCRGDRDKGDGVPYGPLFYTQEQVRELVAYAAERFVTIVPEIEMPGHSLAALAAHPELSCNAGPLAVRTRWGVVEDVYCAGSDKVFGFLQDVLAEVLELFPSKFVHIGGDECPKVRWKSCPRCQARIKAEGLKDEHELQSWFIRRMERYLAGKGRRLVGWDEILEGGLPPGATVMSWRGEEGGIAAARAGHDVIMTPNTHCYFDYSESMAPGEPEAICGHTPLDKVYAYDPVPAALTPEQGRHVLGSQANVWGEYVRTPAEAEYMAFPRTCALAEVCWSPKEGREYGGFLERLKVHLGRLEEMGVNYRRLDP